MLSIDKIESLFGSDEAIGVRMSIDNDEVIPVAEYLVRYGHLPHSEKPDAESLMPDGTSAVCCTNYAHYVREVLGEHGHRVEVVGFANEDNPTARCAQEEYHPGGHDFAIVDRRYLIDPWVRLVAAAEDQIFYDLQDPQHLAKALDIYGPRHLWLPLEPGVEQPFPPIEGNNSMNEPDHMSPQIGDVYYLGELPITITKVNQDIDPDHSGHIVFDNGMETSRLNLGMGCISKRPAPAARSAAPTEALPEELQAALEEHPEIHVEQAHDGKWNFRHDDNVDGPDDSYFSQGCYGTQEEAIRAAFDEYGVEIDGLSVARP